jgi:hypothetical protein
MRETVRRSTIPVVLLALLGLGLGLFCSAGLTGCSSDDVAAPGPQIEDPDTPDLPPGAKTPVVSRDDPGQADW